MVIFVAAKVKETQNERKIDQKREELDSPIRVFSPFFGPLTSVLSGLVVPVADFAVERPDGRVLGPCFVLFGHSDFCCCCPSD